MPLTWPEIRANAQKFSRDWADATSERAEAQTFWNEFFAVFGVQRRRVAVYEKTVSRLKHGAKTANGRIDVFWPSLLLAEHKSAGVDLEAAFQQAADYFDGLIDKELPRFIVVSDFQRFRLYDLEQAGSPASGRHAAGDGGAPGQANAFQEFALKDLHRRIHLFGFIAGYRRQKVREQDPINVEAVQKMGDLHDLFKRDGYEGHPLEVFLVRLLFCLFADDTGIFQPKDAMQDLVENHTKEDGSDLGDKVHHLFSVLNMPSEHRQKSLPEIFAADAAQLHPRQPAFRRQAAPD